MEKGALKIYVEYLFPSLPPDGYAFNGQITSGFPDLLS